MSKLEEPPLVALFYSIIYSKNSDIETCISDLKKEYGKIEITSERFDFGPSEYYTAEMGKGLLRKFIGFEKMIPRDNIVDIKIHSDVLEKKYSSAGKRTINIDPGYLSAEHMILSTGKGFAHRPYLGRGVYADLTLIYSANKFVSLDWTYPDYKSEKIQNYFYELRKLYLNKIRRGK